MLDAKGVPELPEVFVVVWIVAVPACPVCHSKEHPTPLIIWYGEYAFIAIGSLELSCVHSNVIDSVVKYVHDVSTTP